MVWLKDFELPNPLVTKEKRARKSNREIIIISTPINPSGNFPLRITCRPISKNKITAKISGSDTVPVKEKAETKGMVIIYSSSTTLQLYSRPAPT